MDTMNENITVTYKRWTVEEEEILERYYGRIDTNKLCKRLDISYSRFRRKVKAMGLGYQRESDEFITMRQVRSILGIQHYTIKRYIDEGLPVTHKQFGKRSNTMIRLSELTHWLEKNQHMWSAIKVDHLALGVEPEWLRKKRLKEYDERSNFNNRKGVNIL